MPIPVPTAQTPIGPNKTIESLADDIMKFTLGLGREKGKAYAISALISSYSSGMVAGTDLLRGVK